MNGYPQVDILRILVGSFDAEDEGCSGVCRVKPGFADVEGGESRVVDEDDYIALCLKLKPNTVLPRSIVGYRNVLLGHDCVFRLFLDRRNQVFSVLVLILDGILNLLSGLVIDNYFLIIFFDRHTCTCQVREKVVLHT